MNTITLPHNRIQSVDLLRGIIMIIMALDHTRDFFHVSTFVFDPTDLTKTNTALFFTRWITHFCAPSFVFLAGTSIYISLQRKSRGEMSKYLLTRGLWLVVLDVVVLRFAFFFNFYYDMTFLSILWMIGWCMVLMAVIIHLPFRAVAALSIVIIFGHDLTSLVTPGGSAWWTILFSAGFVPPAFVSTYPIIPWTGVMMLGYCIGRLYGEEFTDVGRRKLLLQLGIACVIVFAVVRGINFYGDPRPWSVQSTTWWTIVSFLNVTKYPVSLSFAMMTIGVVMIALSLLERPWSKLVGWTGVFGRVPLFYFLAHFYLIHIAALVVSMIRSGRPFSEIDLHFSASFGGIYAGEGVSLGWVYVAWILIVVSLYPLCKWYDRYKRTHSSRWLSYL